MKPLAALMVIAGLAIATGALTRQAHGAYPGANGRIAFTQQAPYDGGSGQIVLANAERGEIGTVLVGSARGAMSH